MCYNLWYNVLTMLPAGSWPATSWLHYTTSCNTQSSAPEDGQNNSPKPVELIGIINNPLLLHQVGCLYYFISMMHCRANIKIDNSGYYSYVKQGKCGNTACLKFHYILNVQFVTVCLLILYYISHALSYAF